MAKAYSGNTNSQPSPRTEARNVEMPERPGLTDLAKIVAQVDAQGGEETETPPLPPVKGDAPTTDKPTEQPDDAQTDTPPSDEQTQADEQSSEDGEVQTDLSHTDDNAELTEALAGLNADAKKHLAEMARAIASGDTSIGQLKRGHKIAEEFKAQIEELNAKIEDLSAERGAGSATTNAITPKNLPPEIAKLKTIEEVEQAAEKAKAAVRFLEDFLDENPNGGEIGGQSYTRQEIKAKKRAWQDDLEALPKQAHALIRNHEFQTRMNAARSDMETDYPWLKQADHVETKAVKTLVKVAPWQTALPEYSAAVWNRGHKSLQDELAQRKSGGKPPGASARPQGKAPLGKPHTTQAAAPKGSERASANSALIGVMEKGDKTSLAALIAATGR